jgi:hypothetical protein
VNTYLLAQKNDAAFLIEECVDGVFLYIVRPNAFVGDTWHPNIEEAKAQAAFNEGEIVGPWRSISREVGDKLKIGKTEP